MKRTVLLNFLALALVLGVGTVGCKHKPSTVTPVPSGKGAKPSGPDTYGAEPGRSGPGSGETTIAKPVSSDVTDGGVPTTGSGLTPLSGYDPTTSDQDRGPLAADTVYFEFDSSTIKTSEKSKIEAVASYLNSNSNYGLLIEGNCDERGTEQYNLSLGERRALAVREYLINLGIASQRVHTISFGESRPADPAHDAAAWSKNRRDDFVVLKPKQ